MARTPSHKRITGYVYRRLKKFQRELLKHGVESTYSQYELTGEGFRLFFTKVGPASNGEVALFPVLIMGDHTYHDMFGPKYDGRVHGSFRKGFKELTGETSD